MRAHALVVFPSGFGSLNELFELLTLRRTGKVPSRPIVLFDRTYWRSIIRFDALLVHGMVNESDQRPDRLH
jgi:predicted Rossmann-fold nucleotide-binding protein